MRLLKLLLVIVCCCGIVLKKKDIQPLFFELPLETDVPMERSEVGKYTEEDYIAPITIYLVSSDELPRFYESDIKTAVCDDEICELMYVKLYWDLVGKYIGYDTVAAHQLTKFDHEPFSQMDYEKLHQLLRNEGSILKFKDKDELIDKDKAKASDVVDGTTGATALEIKEEVVEGALYSSYTLWHLAYNGSLKNMLNEHTKKVYSPKLKLSFLNSERSGYRYFAVRDFTEKDYMDDVSVWINILQYDIPLTRKTILANIPESMWNDESMQLDLARAFATIDVNSKTVFLNKLAGATYRYTSAVSEISKSIMLLNKYQTETYLSILKGMDSIDEVIKNNILIAKKNPNYKFGHLIDKYRLIDDFNE